MKRCEKCGTSWEQFYKTSMLGCENCYRVFQAELEPVIRKMQGKTRHTGKVPKVGDLDRELLCEYKNLLADREAAMLEGRFDEASALDEEIRQLHYELSRRGLR